MAQYPSLGNVFAVSGAALPTTYTGVGLGTTFNAGVSANSRFVVTIVGAVGTTMTTYTIKLQGYDASASAPADMTSVRNDTNVTELEHVFTVTANSTVCYSFSANMLGFDKNRIVGKATGASISGDSVTVSCVAL
jgi:hypothetical protein